MAKQRRFTEINILLIEDDPGDVRLTREAFKESKILNEILDVGDGIEAFRFLRKEDPYRKVPRPDLILLDLNMPKMDGREFLELMKKDDDLKRIPVVVLTTSEAEKDIFSTYNLHANSYITKPVEFDEFMKVITSIEHFWLQLVKLPNGLK